MIFVDSSFWIAASDNREQRHGEATELLKGVTERLVTSNHVVGETWTFLRRRHRHQIATAFLDRVEAAEGVQIEFTTRDLESDAWNWLRRHDERGYSFVDATSFALMRRFHIREAFAFDDDFAAAGFVELRA